MTEFEVLSDEELQNIQDNLCCMCIGEPPKDLTLGNNFTKTLIALGWRGLRIIFPFVLYVHRRAPQGFDFGKQLLKNSISCQLAKDKATHQQIIREFFDFMDRYNLIKPNDNSLTQFEPFRQIPESDFQALKAKFGGQA